MFKSSISVAWAVDRRGCDFTGCETCPFRVYDRPRYACICPGGASALLHFLPALARLLGQDADAIAPLLGPELEFARVGGTEFDVASADQARALLVHLEAALAGAEQLDEGEERVRAAFAPEAPDQALTELRLVLFFLRDVVARGEELELARYLLARTDV